jgi:hypothetical protein
MNRQAIVFKKIWVDAWSARMEYILNNILLALLEYPDATLLGVNRMLSDKIFRKKVVANISDPSVKSFWTDEFEKYGERYMQEAGAAIQNKIGQFTANPLVRNIVGQPKSSFDVRDIMDNQKILIVNLSKGRIGEQNTSLLGSMIITKIYIAAMSRADVSYARMNDLPSFYFYVDEFQSFANESFANILSEARKYKLALIIAHQYIAQMEEPVRDAVFGNVGTSLSFRVGPLDAEILEKVYAPQFTSNDLINLGMAQIYLSLMINDIGSQPFSAKTLPPIPRPDISYRNDVIEWTREHFARPKETVESNIVDWFAPDPVSIPDFPKTDNKKFIPKDDKKPYVSSNTKKENVSIDYNKPKEEVKYRTPFKKAIEKENSVQFKASTPSPNKFATKTNESEIKPSPELSKLLDSLDGQVPKKIEVQEKENKSLPFTGEKTLRETITPVKHSERGPTEANRNLLKEALLKATASDKIVQKQEPNKNTYTPPVQSPQKESHQNKNNTGEVSHEELQKILE